MDGSGARAPAWLAADRAVWLAEQVLPHEPALRRWLGERLALRAHDVDDVVQESYAKLAALDSIDHVREPRAYLFTVARSLVQQQLRRAQVVAIETMAELDGLGMQAEASRSSPEWFASSRQQLALAQRMLARLPARAREVFQMRRIEGLSQKEISARLKISQSTVEKHMIKALRLLMAEVGAAGDPQAADSVQTRTGRKGRTHGSA